MPLKGKHIILGITGGIAAYKSVYLLRLLIKRGADVQVIITPHGKEFITPVTLSSLSGKSVISEFFTANTGEWHSHVDLGLWADLMIIAPATASSIGKMANGIADNMLITTYLSSKCPVMIAPTMDLDMWKHPSTQRNVKIMEQDGVMIVSPGEGELASGLHGKGRMAEPEEIVHTIENYFKKEETLKGTTCLVTAGPTHEKIDPVRFIGNYSSGKMGFAIAEELASRGAYVYLVAGPVHMEISDSRIKRINVSSAEEMLEATSEIFPQCDIAIFSAAVADYRPEEVADSKIKRDNKEEMVLRLKRNPDIAATLSKKKRKNQITIGFALETENEELNAKSKLERKNLDWIVMNSLNEKGAGFMHDTNKVSIYDRSGFVTQTGIESKKKIASEIIDTILKKDKPSC